MNPRRLFVASCIALIAAWRSPLETACSTSLLAVAQAAQSLMLYQADMALAGGVSVTFPQKRGYQRLDGGMVSADGTCRPFDADATGTIFGSGAGVVLLKRLEAWYRLALRQPAAIIARWQELSTYSEGCAVRVDGGDQAIAGITRGLAPTGALIVETPDGERREIVAGEIRLRKT